MLSRMLRASVAQPAVMPMRPLRSIRPMRPLWAAPRLSRSMFIQTSETPNTDALKFLPSQPVLGAETSRTVEFLNGREAYVSPLARRLFAIDGVKSILLGPDFVTVEKTEDAPWLVLKPEVFSILTEHFASGAPVLNEEAAYMAEDTAPSEDDTEVVAMVKELIDTRIRPAIQEDGGDILYRGITEEGIVKLKLLGACRSCDSSTVTLKNGIESMLMHYVEEVTGVEQVLDPEEEVSLKEFEKLEKRIQDQKTEEDVAPSL